MKKKLMHFYMDTARRLALASTAQRRKVGAILVKDDHIISIGYNGTPAGWDNVCEDSQGATKPYVIHAERNCIEKIARSYNSAEGSSLFVTLEPCLECAKTIYNAGIKEVYYDENYDKLQGHGIAFLWQVQVPTFYFPDLME